MTRSARPTVRGLVSTLVIAVAIPMAAHAGSLTIYNENCTKTANWSTKKRVAVHVFSSTIYSDCTNKIVTVHQGHAKTIDLLAKVYNGGQWRSCEKYGHEAMGTALGKWDVSGGKGSSVTCKKDWLGVCQCTKD